MSTNGSSGDSEEMKAIREAERSLLTELEEGELAPRALRERVIEHAESRGDVSLAFWRLLNRGEIVLTENRTVRLAG